MIIREPRRRRLAAAAARSGCLVSAAAFALSVVGTLATDVHPAGAAIAATAQVITPSEVGVGGSGALLNQGDSATEFSLNLPQGAACTGDTTNDNYRVYGYMIAAATDPTTLTFNSNGPTASSFGNAATLKAPLYDVQDTPFAGASTAPRANAGEPGLIINVPALHFATLAPEGGNALLPPGEYNIGVACWGPVGSSPVLDKFWNVKVTLVASTTDTGPVGIAWTAQNAGIPTAVALAADPASEAAAGRGVTLTATVTPAHASGSVQFKDGTANLGTSVPVVGGRASIETTTLPAGAHALTAAFTPGTTGGFAASTSPPLDYTITGTGATTTTTIGATTATTTAAGTTSTTLASAASAAASSSGNSGGLGTGNGLTSSLARTGGSLSVAVWGLLLLAFGRMAVLLGRQPEVLPSGAR